MGEFLMSFQQLIDHPDEMLYFNYTIEDVISNLWSKKKKKKLIWKNWSWPKSPNQIKLEDFNSRRK